MQNERKGSGDEAKIKACFEQVTAAAHFACESDAEETHEGGRGEECEGTHGHGNENAEHGGVDGGKQARLSPQEHGKEKGSSRVRKGEDEQHSRPTFCVAKIQQEDDEGEMNDDGS